MSSIAFRDRVKTKTGCNTCRVRRKKCDDKHPVCGHCERLSLSCSWIRINVQAGPASSQCLALQGVDTVKTAVKIRSTSARIGDASSNIFDHPSILHASPTSFLTSYQDKQAYQYLCERGNNVLKISKRNLKSSQNVFTLGITLIEKAPELRNAYLALAAARVFRAQDSNPVAAVKYYQRSLQYLRLELARTDIAQPSELACATGAVLSIYEMSIFTDREARLAHFLGFIAMTQSKLRLDPYAWGPTKIVLEIYTYMFVVHSTFYAKETLENKSYDYADGLIQIIDSGLRLLGPNVAGVPSDMLSTVYRLSWIRWKCVTDHTDCTQTTKLSTILNELEALFPDRGSANKDQTGEESLVAGLYHCACSIFAQKLVHRELTADDRAISKYVRNAMEMMAYSTRGQVPPICVGWPLVIIGLSAQTRTELETMCRPLFDLIEAGGMLGLCSAIEFLMKAWSNGPGSGSYLGLNALFDDDLLRIVHL